MTLLDNPPSIDELNAFRKLIKDCNSGETADPEPILQWLNGLRNKTELKAKKIGLTEAQKWSADPNTGNIIHDSGAFFSIEAVHVRAGNLREVVEWDQPIYNQLEGGVLALITATRNDGISFLIQAKAEPGNIGTLQLAPTLQCTWSNLKIAHKGKRPVLAEALDDGAPGRLIYCAKHNEEGGRFWQKSNSNCIIHFPEPEWIEQRATDHFIWVSLPQIKALALIDNVLSPFVKTIIAPI